MSAVKTVEQLGTEIRAPQAQREAVRLASIALESVYR